MQPLVSVIIPVLNDPKRLALCLDSLDRQTYPKNRFEVIVIDNGSDEWRSPRMSTTDRFRLCVETRKGPYAARNTGVAISRGEILGFTDADVIVAEDWIEQGVRALVDLKNGGLVAGRVDFFFRHPERPNSIERFESLTYLCQEKHVEQERFGAIANLFTWRHVFDRVGGFDPKLIANGDRIFGNRVHDAGYRLSFGDHVRVLHPARRTIGELTSRVARNFAGHYETKRRRGYPPGEVLADLLEDLVAPIRAIPEVARLEGLDGLWSRVTFFAVGAYRRYVGMFKRVRLTLGGSPRW